MLKDMDQVGSGSDIKAVDIWRQKAATCQALADKANTPQDKSRWTKMTRFWLAKIQLHEQGRPQQATQLSEPAPE